MKTITLQDPIAMISDGAKPMIGGFMAGSSERLIDELVQQGKRNLTVIANESSGDGDRAFSSGIREISTVLPARFFSGCSRGSRRRDEQLDGIETAATAFLGKRRSLGRTDNQRKMDSCGEQLARVADSCKALCWSGLTMACGKGGIAWPCHSRDVAFNHPCGNIPRHSRGHDVGLSQDRKPIRRCGR